MKFGASLATPTGGQEPCWSKRLAGLADSGFDGVELYIEDPRNLVSLQRAHKGFVANGLVVTVEGAFRGVGAVGDHMRGLIDACMVIDSRLLCGAFEFADNADGVAEFRDVAKYAQTLGVTLAFGSDGAPDANASTVAETVRYVENANISSVGILYNTLQSHVHEASPSGAILSAGPALKHVQIAENDRSVPGSGQVRWAETFAALAAIRYDAWYVVKDNAPDDDGERAKRGLAFLVQHVQRKQHDSGSECDEQAVARDRKSN